MNLSSSLLFFLIMTDLDKFFSDTSGILRSIYKNDASSLNEARSRLLNLFTRDFSRLPGIPAGLEEELLNYWDEKYGAVLLSWQSSAEQKEEAVRWLGNVLALFSGCFEEDMDFSGEDWNELKEAVSAESVSMDIQLLSEIMSVFVSRGVL